MNRRVVTILVIVAIAVVAVMLFRRSRYSARG